ncbi:MAG: hypothetical protein ACR2LV_05490 [Solirubrobacteraceae bacterium]
MAAYLALFVALGGTAVAAVNLPAGSVGNRQLRNRSVTPSKLGGKIDAVVRYWAVVSGSGRVLDSGSVRPRVNGGAGHVEILFKPHPAAGRCFVLGNVMGAAPGGISADFEMIGNNIVSVGTGTATGPFAVKVAVAVLCSP